MSEIFIIAGPQAAGKSTIISRLTTHYSMLAALFPNNPKHLFFPIQESRQIVVHKHLLLGGIFMNREHEEEIVACDLQRMKIIHERNQRHITYLDECNVFTIAHALAHGVREIGDHWHNYLTHLEKLQAKIIFLNIAPEISWERRRANYLQRLVYFPVGEHANLMRQYRDYLEKLYPLLLDVYDKLPFPKVMVDASISEHRTVEEVSRRIAALSSGPDI